MKLTQEEKAMLAGEMGETAREALAQQMKVGAFFRAADFVPVRTVARDGRYRGACGSGASFSGRNSGGGRTFPGPGDHQSKECGFLALEGGGDRKRRR